MTVVDIETALHDPALRAELNRDLAVMKAEARVEFALAHLPGAQALSSSFGAQAAVSLHLVASRAPTIPVILVDTGYLFPETYQFIDELRDRLDLNLQITSARESPAWFEARHGRLWEQGRDGIALYNKLRKVEPMQVALKQLGIRSWFAGLRRSQSESRAGIEVLAVQDGRFKLHPIVDWSDRDIWQYLTRFGLPYHPLWHQGYVSIGDIHTTRPLLDGMREEDTRFFGLKRECGLHELEDDKA